MRLKNTFLILLKLVVIVGLIVYLPSKVSSPSKAQVINAIDNSNQVTASYQNMESKVVKDKKIHIYNTHQGDVYKRQLSILNFQRNRIFIFIAVDEVGVVNILVFVIVCMILVMRQI